MPGDTTQRYRFTGQGPTGYFAYADLDGTSGMLVAEFGGEYALRALEPGLPVPPADGQWEPVAPKAGKGKAAADPEGGE